MRVGGLCALEAGADVCGIKPVRTIGGCRSVEIAESVSNCIMVPRGRPTILAGFVQAVPM